MLWAFACGVACTNAHTCRGQRKSQQPACLLYLLILFLKWLPLITVAISDSIQGNTLAFPLVHFSVSTVYIWHWQLSRRSAWTLDAVVDTLAFSPIANLFLFSVTYQCFLCLSSALPLPVSVAMAHVITQEFSWPAVANTTYMVFSPWAREAHSLLSALLFSPPGSFSCLLGDWAPLDSGRAISSGSLCP